MDSLIQFIIYLIFICAIAGAFIWAVQKWLTVAPPPLRNLICFLIAVVAIWAIWSGYPHAAIVHSAR